MRAGEKDFVEIRIEFVFDVPSDMTRVKKSIEQDRPPTTSVRRKGNPRDGDHASKTYSLVNIVYFM